MSVLGTTRMSSKGQVVIPEKIRNALHLEPGAEFAVVGMGDTVMLKIIQAPSMDELDGLMKAGRDYAKKHDLKESDISKAIKEVRAERRARSGD